MLTFPLFAPACAIIEYIAVKADQGLLLPNACIAAASSPPIAQKGRGNSYLGKDETERSYARALTHGVCCVLPCLSM